MRYLFLSGALILSGAAAAWPNGPAGNAQTDEPAECSNPPYSTHDFVADHGLMLLPDQERAWLMPHRQMYLLGTEAPDNNDIPDACNAPNNGYDDRGSGHSVEWQTDYSSFASWPNGSLKDRAARRAQEEYSKAVVAYERGLFSDAAFYLGAMAHYIGDVSQFGHSVPDEDNHSNYENWSKRRASSFDDPDLRGFIQLDNLVRRRPYTAVKRISLMTARGRGDILSASVMDRKYGDGERDDVFVKSVGASVNIGANEIADVLHTFYLNVVNE